MSRKKYNESFFEQMGMNEDDVEITRTAISVGKIVMIIGILIFCLFGSVYQVKEQEQAVLITFGQAEAVTDPGLHFKIPFFQNVEKVDTTIRGLEIGYVTVEGKEGFITGETKGGVYSVPEESLMITNDYNFVNVDLFAEYRVSDPVIALYSTEDPVGILKNICQSSIRSVISGYSVDDVLTTGKNEIQAAIKADIIKELDERNIGIQLVNITIQDSEPPTDTVMEAFKAVETAKQGKETTLNNANKYRNEKLPAAQASADKIVKDAEAEKTKRVNEATAQVARFNAMYEEYIKNPEMTKLRMFYETMEDVLPSLKVVIQSDSGNVQTIYPVESFN